MLWELSRIHPGLPREAVVPALAPKHSCPHGGWGGSSPAAASATHSFSQPALGQARGLLLPPLWGSRPSLKPAPLGPPSSLLPGSFPNPHWSLGLLAPRRASWVPPLPSARACLLLKQPNWLLVDFEGGWTDTPLPLTLRLKSQDLTVTFTRPWVYSNTWDSTGNGLIHLGIM